MGETKFITSKEAQAEYGVSRKYFERAALVIGTAPRHKGEKIYVPREEFDAYMRSQLKGAF